MSKAFLFLNTFEDAEYAVKVLGFPVELVPQTPIKTGETIQVNSREELENAYHRLCSNNSTGEFTALRI
jgi:formate-dependent phosphoribosylglycinamide formyltransferase (GAR transformylase)